MSFIAILMEAETPWDEIVLSGHWKDGWKWKQCESLTAVGAVTTSKLNSEFWEGNGNSMLRNYKQTTEK